MFQNISVIDALKKTMSGDAVLIDLRTEEEFRAGHLPMAVHGGEKIDNILKKNKDKAVILYCSYGNLSLKMAKEYGEEGYQLYSIVGGYHAYRGYIEIRKNDMWTMEWKNS